MDWVLDQVLAQWQAQAHLINVEIWLDVLYKYKRCMYTNTLDVLSTSSLDTCIGHLSNVYWY